MKDLTSSFLNQGAVQNPMQGQMRPQGNSNPIDYGSIFTNPLTIAGLKILNPNMGNQLEAAALEKRKQQETQRQESEFQRQQMIAQALPQILNEIDWNNPGAAQSQLAQIGLTPQEMIPLFNIFKGNRELELNERKLGVQQQALAQKQSQKTQLPPAERRLNIANLKKIGDTAEAARTTLRELDQLEKAYDDFDKYTNSWTGSGSFVSSLLPGTDENENIVTRISKKIGENTLNDNARGALHRITKINSALTRAQIAELKGTGPVTDVLKKEIKRGLPVPEQLPEARKEIIKNIQYEAYKKDLKGKFYTEWAHINNNDLSNAEDAFVRLTEALPILDENGNLNREIEKIIPEFIRELLSESNTDEPQDFSQYFGEF